MSEQSSVGPEKTVPAKKKASPARNIIGLVVLAGVLVVGWFEWSARIRFDNAMAALKARSEDENKVLMTVQEAEKLIGKEPDGPAVDYQDGLWKFNQQTYTWQGLLKNHTLTAYYTKEQDSRLHHYETDGAKYELPSTQAPPTTSANKKGGSSSKDETKKSGTPPSGSAPQPKIVPDSKSEPTAPSDEAATPKPEPNDKAATPKPEPSDKAATPKPEPSDKAATPKT